MALSSTESTALAGRDRDMGRGMRLSVILHVGLALFVLLKSLVFPGNPVPLVPTLRVDLVGLPDILKKDLAHVPKAEPPAKETLPKPEPKPVVTKPEPVRAKPAPPVEKAEPDEMVMKPKRLQETKEKDSKRREKRLKSALDRIKALAKINDELHAKPKKSAASLLIKGNKISKGTSLSGDAREADVASYYDSLRDSLQSNWALPVWIARQNLSAQVQLYIDGRGRVRNLRFVRPSGNPQFDDAVKRTIAESQPFVPPPESIASNVLVDGILVGFPL